MAESVVTAAPVVALEVEVDSVCEVVVDVEVVEVWTPAVVESACVDSVL